MLSIDKKVLTFDIKEVHFSDHPHDIDDCDFLNFRYCKNKVDVKGFTRKKEFTMVVDLTQDLNTIWQNMDNKNVKYWIKRAQREGIRIRINEDYNQFFQMYRSFIQKKGIKSLFDVFGLGSTTLENMKKNGTLFVAECNGEILAGTLYLEDDSQIRSWIGASKRFEVDNKTKLMACADRLIDWEAIKYAKAKGIKEFDLGGIWSEEEAEKDIAKKGINTFKLSLGGKTVTRYSYQKFYSKTCSLAYYLYGLKNLGRQEM
jgi:lipid II:glycine glycyltransferase (peptidoglycan interpeptide bridge formation enzyme)